MNFEQLCSAEMPVQHWFPRWKIIGWVSRQHQSVPKKASFRTLDIFLQLHGEFRLEAEGQGLHTIHDRNLDKQRVEALQTYSLQRQD
jgi:hypothetical protein